MKKNKSAEGANPWKGGSAAETLCPRLQGHSRSKRDFSRKGGATDCSDVSRLRETEKKRVCGDAKDGTRLLLWILGLAAAMLVLTSFVRAAAPRTETVTVTVRDGDTLWNLWEHYGYGRADRWIDEVERINQIKGARIYPGDEIRVEAFK